jgi:prepilin-type N-terminal cleavage/methylation domain-containing protein
METKPVMSITTALKARREALTDREAGFTLIELLVVVIIIGILAAIAIPIYIGVQNNAKDSSVKSDLSNQKTAVVAYETDKGTLPAAAASPPARPSTAPRRTAATLRPRSSASRPPRSRPTSSS